MPRPFIVCVAIAGSLPRKVDNQAVKVTIEEPLKSMHDRVCSSAGGGALA